MCMNNVLRLSIRSNLRYMRGWLFAAFLLVMHSAGFAQRSVTDSLWSVANHPPSDTDKAKAFYNLSYYYQNNKPDSALLLAQTAYRLSQKAGFEKGEAFSLGSIAGAFDQLGNFPKALEYYLRELKFAEEKKNSKELASVSINIAMVYNNQNDIANALRYAYAADSIVKAAALTTLSLYTSLDIGDIYTNAGELDSAAVYTDRCYRKALQEKNRMFTGTALNNLGNIFFKRGDYARAKDFYTKSRPYIVAEEDYNLLAESNLGLAQAFDKLGRPDSALAYAKKAYAVAGDNGFLKHAMNASFFLTALYKKAARIDSAFARQQTYLALKDSFDNSEKIKAMQSLTIAEEMRQRQLAEERDEEARERSKRLQLLLIAAFIPVFFFMTVYIAKKRVKHKVIETLGVLSLLFFFEFITLLIHPVVSNTAHHSPVLELLLLVAIAALLLPAHHKVEHWLVTRLTSRHEKHLAAREAAAKKAEEAE